MSEPRRIIWSRRVRHAKAVKGPARAVLYAIADRLNEHDVTWASQAALAEDAGVSERTVRDAFQALRDGGYLAVDARPGSSAVLRLTIDEEGRSTGEIAKPASDAVSTPAGGATPAGAAANPGRSCRPPRQEAPGTPAGAAAEVPMKYPLKDQGKGGARAPDPDPTPEAEAVDRLAEAWATLRPDDPAPDRKPFFGMLHRCADPTVPLGERERIALRVLRFVALAPDKRGAWGNAPTWLRGQGAAIPRLVVDLANGGERLRSLVAWSDSWEREGSHREGDAPVDPAALAWENMTRRKGWRSGQPPNRPQNFGSPKLWDLADDVAEHARRWHALDAIGGWRARQSLPAMDLNEWSPKVHADFRSAWCRAWTENRRGAA